MRHRGRTGSEGHAGPVSTHAPSCHVRGCRLVLSASRLGEPQLNTNKQTSVGQERQQWANLRFSQPDSTSRPERANFDQIQINKEQTNRSSRANNKYIYCGVRPDLLIRMLYLINGFAKSAGSLREVCGKSAGSLREVFARARKI